MGLNHSILQKTLADKENFDENFLILNKSKRKRKKKSIKIIMKEDLLLQNSKQSTNINRFGFKISQQQPITTPTTTTIGSTQTKSKVIDSNKTQQNENSQPVQTTTAISQQQPQPQNRKSPLRSLLKAPMNILCMSNNTTSNYDLKTLQQPIDATPTTQMTKLPLNKTKSQQIKMDFVQSSSSSSTSSTTQSVVQVKPPKPTPTATTTTTNGYLPSSSQSSINSTLSSVSSTTTSSIMQPSIPQPLSKSTSYKINSNYNETQMPQTTNIVRHQSQAQPHTNILSTYKFNSQLKRPHSVNLTSKPSIQPERPPSLSSVNNKMKINSIDNCETNETKSQMSLQTASVIYQKTNLKKFNINENGKIEAKSQQNVIIDEKLKQEQRSQSSTIPTINPLLISPPESPANDEKKYVMLDLETYNSLLDEMASTKLALCKLASILANNNNSDEGDCDIETTMNQLVLNVSVFRAS